MPGAPTRCCARRGMRRCAFADSRIHLRRWGPAPSAMRRPVVLLHGCQDTGDTFQFLVDEFERDWPLAALDWRGFGRSDWAPDGYWFPEYLADLDALLELLSFEPAGPAHRPQHGR